MSTPAEGSNLLAAPQWLTLDRTHRPLADRPCAVLQRGQGLNCWAQISEDEDDAGLYLVCKEGGVTWNVDRDDPTELPSHFFQLPRLPR